jgi:hypothetical protein
VALVSNASHHALVGDGFVLRGIVEALHQHGVAYSEAVISGPVWRLARASLEVKPLHEPRGVLARVLELHVALARGGARRGRRARLLCGPVQANHAL